MTEEELLLKEAKDAIARPQPTDPVVDSYRQRVEEVQSDRLAAPVEDAPEEEAPTLGESALAWVQNETMMGQMAKDLGVYMSGDGSVDDFNSTSHAFSKDNKDKYADVQSLVLQGEADHISSPDHFDAWAESVRGERKNRKIIAETGTATNIGLGLVTGFFDAPNLLTLGVGGVGGGALRTGLTVGGVAMGTTAATEAYLYNSQVDRTVDEALTSIGTSGAFGFLGGSVLSHLMSNTSMTKTVSKSMQDDLPVFEVKGGSLSAARADAEAATGEFKDTRGKLMKAVDWMLDKTSFTTSPSVVAARASSERVRDTFAKIADIGIVDNRVERGEMAAGISSEQWREGWQNYSNGAMMGHDAVYRKALAKMGDTAPFAALRSEMPNGMAVKLSRDDFDKEVFLSMTFKDRKADVPYAAEVAESVGVWREHYDRYLTEGRRLGIFSGENDTSFEGFYMPQLWNRSKVIQNPDALKKILFEGYRQDFDAQYLKERHGLTMEAYDQLDPADQQYISDKYNEHNDTVAWERSNARLAELNRFKADIHNEMKLASKTARMEGTKSNNSLLRAVEYDAKELVTKREKYFADIAQEKQMRDTLANAGTAMRQAELARAETMIDPPEGVDFKGMKDLFDRRQRAADKLLAFHTDPDKFIKPKHSQPIHGESKAVRYDSGYRNASKKLIDDYQRFEQEWSDALGRPKVAPDDPRLRAPIDDPKYQYLKGLADESNRQLAVRDRMVARLEGQLSRLEDLKAKYVEINTKAKAAAAEAKMAKEKLARWKAGAQKAADKESKIADRIDEKGLSTKALVEQLVNNISRRDAFPSGMLYDGALGASAVGESGRVKHRAIDLTKLGEKGVRELLDAGMLDFRPNEMAMRYSRDMGGRMGLRENFGSEDLTDAWKTIADDYEAKRVAARAKGDTKAVARLIAEEAKVKQHMSMMIDKELGRWDVNSTASIGEGVLWAGNMARQANAIRFLGGSAIASFSDIATMSLQKNPIVVMGKAFGTNIEAVVREANSRQLASVLFAAENNPGMARYSQLYSLDDMYHEHGFGFGATRKVTSGIETVTRYMGSKLNTLNFMRAWNGRMSFVAGHDVLSNILDAGETLAKGGKLSDKTLRDMAFVHLDESDLKAIHQLNSQYSEEVIKGYRMPLMDEWVKTEGGFAMSQKLTIAIDKASRRAVLRPGTGDLPPFVSTFMGKMLFQFQSFAYAAVNKYFRNMDRMARGSSAEGMQALASIAWAVAAGATVYTARVGVVNNKWDEVRETWSNPAAIAREAIDRGGLTLMYGPYVSAGMKLAGPHLEAAGIPVSKMGLAAPSRFKERTPMNDLLGPTFSLGEDIQKVFTAESGEKAVKALQRLAPYRNLFWMDMLLNNVKI